MEWLRRQVPVRLLLVNLLETSVETAPDWDRVYSHVCPTHYRIVMAFKATCHSLHGTCLVILGTTTLIQARLMNAGAHLKANTQAI
jgi:hypothetical protein